MPKYYKRATVFKDEEILTSTQLFACSIKCGCALERKWGRAVSAVGTFLWSSLQPCGWSGFRSPWDFVLLFVFVFQKAFRIVATLQTKVLTARHKWHNLCFESNTTNNTTVGMLFCYEFPVFHVTSVMTRCVNYWMQKVNEKLMTVTNSSGWLQEEEIWKQVLPRL